MKTLGRLLGTTIAIATLATLSGCESSKGSSTKYSIPSNTVSTTESHSSSGSDRKPPVPKISLNSPSNYAVVDRNVTFSWSQGSPNIIDYTVFTDKGRNPLDGGYEDAFNAGESTSKSVSLSTSRYFIGTKFEWGVIGIDGNGKVHRSNVRTAYLLKAPEDN